MKLMEMFRTHRAPVIGLHSGLSRALRSPVPEIRDMLNRLVAYAGEDTAAAIQSIPGYAKLSVLPQSWLLGDNISDFAAQFSSGIQEVIHWALYSYVVYPAAGATQLQLFGTNAGSTAGSGYGDTNLQQQGQMAGGEAHLATKLAVDWIPATSDAFVTAAIAPAFLEAYRALRAGLASSATNAGNWLELRIGDKLYLQQGPLTLFPSGMGLSEGLFASTATGNVQSISLPQNGHPSNMAAWEMKPPLLILPNRTFNVTLNWKGLCAVTDASSGITRVGVILDGFRIRAIQ